MNTYIYILFIFILLVIIGIREGYMIRWALNGHPVKDSNIWHKLGGVLRIIPALIIAYAIWPDWKGIILAGLLWANWAWTLYDVCINIINHWPMYYQGQSSLSEKVLKKRLIWIGKGLLFSGTIVYVLYYFNMIKI